MYTVNICQQNNSCRIKPGVAAKGIWKIFATRVLWSCVLAGKNDMQLGEDVIQCPVIPFSHSAWNWQRLQDGHYKSCQCHHGFPFKVLCVASFRLFHHGRSRAHTPRDCVGRIQREKWPEHGWRDRSWVTSSSVLDLNSAWFSISLICLKICFIVNTEYRISWLQIGKVCFWDI